MLRVPQKITRRIIETIFLSNDAFSSELHYYCIVKHDKVIKYTFGCLSIKSNDMPAICVHNIMHFIIAYPTGRHRKRKRGVLCCFFKLMKLFKLFFFVCLFNLNEIFHCSFSSIIKNINKACICMCIYFEKKSYWFDNDLSSHICSWARYSARQFAFWSAISQFCSEIFKIQTIIWPWKTLKPENRRW